jgi:hypothetical protein
MPTNDGGGPAASTELPIAKFGAGNLFVLIEEIREWFHFKQKVLIA